MLLQRRTLTNGWTVEYSNKKWRNFQMLFTQITNNEKNIASRSTQNAFVCIFEVPHFQISHSYTVFLNIMNHDAIFESYEYRLLYLNCFVQKIWFVTKSMNDENIDLDLSKISIAAMKNWTIHDDASMRRWKKWVMFTHNGNLW